MSTQMLYAPFGSQDRLASAGRPFVQSVAHRNALIYTYTDGNWVEHQQVVWMN